MSDTVRVLIVEDEPLTAEAHAAYLARLDGFTVVGSAATGRAMLAAVAAEQPDLVLLDLNLPDAHGLQLVRALRAAGSAVDVIAVTAAHDARGVKNAIALGIVQYLVKPFSYRTFAERLTTYREFRRGFEDRRSLTQADIDQSLGSLRPTAPPDHEKGIARETLDAVRAHLVQADGAASASEVADALGISRVTARRYLEHLIGAGQAGKDVRYSGPGRPEYAYRWLR
ncbi:response regulator [Curtobacterium sp. 1P10AnD]|uniref:response regulator n=1 Tax=Curtobacterium sp. 1P10AnD TaxID=3132283 RepID=UPI00399EFA17